MIQPYLNSVGLICKLGENKDQILKTLHLTPNRYPLLSDKFSPGNLLPVAQVETILPKIPSAYKDYETRTNQLLFSAIEQIKPIVNEAIDRYGHSRIAVVIGTSTSGIAEGEKAISYHSQHSKLPVNFTYKYQELATTSEFIAKLFGVTGPAYAISTSCSSSSTAISSAQRLLNTGLCDAVIVGGADALCQTTVQGFHSLGAISSKTCNPFSQNRDGILIGEAAALFLMSREAKFESEDTKIPIRLLGSGNSSDAHHISAPDPAGKGAHLAMKQALNNANLQATEIDYINLHGTATQQNDSMESRAVHAIFSNQTLCSSTKPLTGHCLGASGAIELALCWLLLSPLNQSRRLPIQHWDRIADPELPRINLVNHEQQSATHLSVIMSNTYSFGGNNASLIIGSQQ